MEKVQLQGGQRPHLVTRRDDSPQLIAPVKEWQRTALRATPARKGLVTMAKAIQYASRTRETPARKSNRAVLAAAPRPHGVPVPPVQRKCACGGACPKCQDEKSHRRLPKLKINAPGDEYEQEADRVAAAVTGDGEAAGPLEVRRPVTPGQPGFENPRLSATVGAALRGPGRPLDAGTLTFMESRIGHDLRDVRIHDGAGAAETARAIHARAFTRGGDIAFAEGEYRPRTPSGRLLLAHELAHVVQQRSADPNPPVQRQASAAVSTPDWQHQAERMTTQELIDAIEALRVEWTEVLENSEEGEQIEEQLGVFENALLDRQAGQVTFDRTVAAVRESAPVSVGTLANLPLTYLQLEDLRSRAESMFVLGVYSGFTTEIPPASLEDFAQELREHWLEFVGGYYVGIPVGLWNGLTGLVEGLAMMAQIALQIGSFSLSQFVVEQAVEYASDPEGYVEKRRREYQQARDLAVALRAFGDEVRADPTVVIQWSSDLGVALGRDLADWVADDFLPLSPFDKGQRAGDIAGQILFEVLLEIILALATRGIGNAVRAAGAAAQIARAGGRAARIIRPMLESSPALRRIVRALTGAEEAADATRLAERGADVARAGGDEALESSRGLAGAADESVETAQDVTAMTSEPGRLPAGSLPAEDLARVGPVNDETRILFGNHPELLEAWADHPLAARLLKHCTSPCFPDNMSPKQIRFLQDILADVHRRGLTPQDIGIDASTFRRTIEGSTSDGVWDALLDAEYRLDDRVEILRQTLLPGASERGLTDEGLRIAGATGRAHDNPGKILRRNVGPERGYQTHHIIPWEWREHLAVYEYERLIAGVDNPRADTQGRWMNSKNNGVNLPSSAAVEGAEDLTIHRGPHPKYTAWVDGRLDQLWHRYSSGELDLPKFGREFEGLVGEFENCLRTQCFGRVTEEGRRMVR